MVKKSSVKISGVAVLRIIIFLFLGLSFFTVYVNAVDFLTKSPLFEVKDVMVERSIQFIDKRSLKDLKGKNIFKVDLTRVHRQINQRYPYIAQLRVVRQLPDKILILAKKREPLLQIYYKKKYLLVDTEGVALYYVVQPVNLPQVYGIPLDRNGTFLGGHVHGTQLNKTVEILNAFKESEHLKNWRIQQIQTGNLSKIEVVVGENMHVILDQENTRDKIGLLQMLVAANKIDLKKVKYIDLRFKEPVIADNVEEDDKE